MDYCRRIPESLREEDLNKKNKFTFIVEWYDPIAQIIKTFLMSFYPEDKSVELFDCKNHRSFLRRTKIDGIDRENLYKTAIVNILSRQMKIVDYADAQTRDIYEKVLGRTFCMVKPDVAHRVGEIITFMQEHSYKIIKLKMGRMTVECAEEFYKEHQGQTYLQYLLKFVTSETCVAMVAMGENALKKWRDLIGPTDSEVAKKEAPNTLRAVYGTDIIRNGVHGSKDEEHECDTWFPNIKPEIPRILPTCVLKNTTCAIIKPHAVVEGTVGPIMNYIDENGFRITAMEMFYMDVPMSEEFFEVYKGVVPEFSAMVTQMTSGPCIAMEILDKNSECSQETFRKFTGPSDPDIARKLRPNTIRAKFGKTKVMNAIHCTDLPDDAQLELEYFFKILQSY